MKLTLNSLFQAVRYALDVTSYDSVFLKVTSLYVTQCVIGVLPTGYGKSVIFHLLPYMWDYMWNEKEKQALQDVSNRYFRYSIEIDRNRS